MSEALTKEKIQAAAKDARGREFLHKFRVIVEGQLKLADEQLEKARRSCDKQRQLLRDISEALGEVQA